MQLELTEDQQAFRDVTRRFIESEVPLTAVRDLYDSPDGYSRQWWRSAAELGWASLFVPDEHGGGSLSGGSTRDAVIVAEEIGRGIAPGPFLVNNLAAASIARGADRELQKAVLPDIVTGDIVATWAFAEARGTWDLDGVETTAVAVGDTLVLNGTKCFVEAASSASHALVTARTHGEPTQVVAALDSPGITVTAGRSIDMTRRFGRIAFKNVEIPARNIVGEIGGAGDAVDAQLDLAVALQCAEMVGIADRTFEFTLEYGRDRFAFGRPIVSYQALKHRIADMAQWLEASKAVADELADTIDNEKPSRELAHVAKAYIGDRTARIVDDCVQITGGIGVTWEHDIHMFNRRIALDRALYGTPEKHRDRLYSHLASTVGGIS